MSKLTDYLEDDGGLGALHGDPFKDNQSEDIWAVIIQKEDGSEGLAYIGGIIAEDIDYYPAGALVQKPLICSAVEMLNDLKDMAQAMADQTHEKLVIRHFRRANEKEDVLFEPREEV